MSGRGNIKDPSVRKRRNKSASSAVLTHDHQVPTPALPEGDWHPMTMWWWKDVWQSPMATEYLAADMSALTRLAYLIDLFWREPTAKNSAEIRMAQRPFGLSPLDRRRLEWTIENAESAKDRRRDHYTYESNARA